jgi:aminoglycoside phosphotransferase (APT) family kinase protein
VEVLHTEPLPAGAYHEHELARLADGRRVVLRRARASQWGLPIDEQLAREAATLRALDGTAGAPRLVDLRPDLLVETFVEGRPFAYATDLPALGRALAAVHAVPAPHLPALDAVRALHEDAAAWLARADPSVRAVLEELAAALPAATPAAPAVLVHTDLNPGNLLVGPGGDVRLLDWEGARRGHPAWDLAHALSPTTTTWDPRCATELGPRDARALARAYLAAGGRPEAVRDLPAVMDAVVLRAAAWCAGVEVRPGDDLEARVARYRAPGALRGALARARRLAHAITTDLEDEGT